MLVFRGWYRIVAGMEGKPLTDGKAKSLVAYHEVMRGCLHVSQ